MSGRVRLDLNWDVNGYCLTPADRKRETLQMY